VAGERSSGEGRGKGKKGGIEVVRIKGEGGLEGGRHGGREGGREGERERGREL